MRTLPSPPPSPHRSGKTKQRKRANLKLTALILCEPAETPRALRITGLLEKYAGKDFPACVAIRTTDTLECREHRNAVLQHALGSDIVILVASGKKPPPDGLWRWLRLFLTLTGNKEKAIFVSLSSRSPEWKSWIHDELAGTNIYLSLHEPPQTRFRRVFAHEGIGLHATE